MSYGVKLEVWSDYACFTRTEMKVERVSYDVITPSAARAILQSIHWKPAIQWHINKIHVLNEIKFANIKRNEVGSKMLPKNPYLNVVDNRTQRFSMILKDVRYIIEANFSLTDKKGEEDTEEKHISIAKRRMQLGQTFNQPYLGCREFSCGFKLLEDESEIPESFYKGEAEKDLGFMLHDIDFTNNNQPQFFRAIMKNGVIDTKRAEVIS
ncbi:MAG: type I-C CRISPR-associated protein Cas5c [Alphaproteobacteria bacterium]|jgi:CRISPR-associated protein Cas5d|nr:type I-C CRISPR-associated protein Cas5c [Alphaproteobacteria bacterium]